jgi:heme/copper-type cytochrome/quinol oxidase subunit 2
MKLTRRTVGWLLAGAGACLVAGPAVVRLLAGAPVAAGQPRSGAAQEQAPNRREFTVTARNFRFSPDRIEVAQDDLVKLTVQSEDHAYSITIDEYRISRRIPAGGSTVLEFRADRPGMFAFYSNLSDSRHAEMRGVLIVRPR